jgi:hypothetical protein
LTLSPRNSAKRHTGTSCCNSKPSERITSPTS